MIPREVRVCRLCGERLATVRDREAGSSPIPAICEECHAEMLRGDLEVIPAARREAAAGGIG